MCGVRFQVNVDKSDLRNVTKCSPFAFAFTEEKSRERVNLLAD